MRRALILCWLAACAPVARAPGTTQPGANEPRANDPKREPVEGAEGAFADDPSAAPAPRPATASADAAETGAACGSVPADMSCVVGGTFERGDPGDPATAPVEAVTVSTFLMDRREVSNAAYAECVDAAVCAPAFPFRGFGAPDLPAVAMRWEDARAYCAWKGKRLPFEAEWERAARGAGNTRWPHGDERGGCGRVHVRDARGRGCGTELTRPVGTLPAGHWGLHDMAGNVDEWVQDWFSDCYRGCPGECGDDCAGVDPRGPCGGAAACPGRSRRVVRGGSWWWSEPFATGSRRRGKPPSNTAHHRYGFRCARDA